MPDILELKPLYDSSILNIYTTHIHIRHKMYEVNKLLVLTANKEDTQFI